MVYLGQDTLGLVMLLKHPSTFQRMLDIGESTQMVHLVCLVRLVMGLAMLANLGMNFL